MLEEAGLARARDLSLRGFVNRDDPEAELVDYLSASAWALRDLDLNLCLCGRTLLPSEAGLLLSDCSPSVSVLSLAISTLFLRLIWTLLCSAIAGREEPEDPEDLEGEVRAL